MSWKGTLEGNIPIKGLTQWREDATLSYKQTLEGLNAIIGARSTGSLKSRQIEPAGLLEMTKNPSFMDTLISVGGKDFALTIETVSGRLLAPDLWSLSLGFGKVKKTAFSYESVDVEFHDRWKYLIMEDFDTDAEWDASLPSLTYFQSTGYGRQVQDIRWEIIGGSWGVNSTVNGLIGPSDPPTALECTSGAGTMYAGWEHWDDYDFSVRFITDLSTDRIGIHFRVLDEDNYYIWYWSSTTNLKLRKRVSGVNYDVGDTTITITEDVWTHIKIVCQGNRIRGYLNEVEMFDLVDDSLPSGKVGLYTSATNVYFDDMRVTLLPPENFNMPAIADAIDQYTHKSINTAHGTQRRMIAPKDNINFEVNQGEDCVLYLPLNEGEGTPRDQSKNNSSVTLTGGTWVEDLEKGWCLKFDGSSDYLSVDVGALMDGEECAVLTFDFNLPTNGIGKYFLELGTSITDRILIYDTGSDILRTHDDITNTGNNVLDHPFTRGVWYRYTLLMSDKYFFVFFDEELFAVYEAPTAGFSDLDPDYLTLGAAGGLSPTSFATAIIQNLRLFTAPRWDVALGFDQTPTSVFCFDNYGGPDDSDCVLLLHMDEGVGNTLYDASGNGNDGTGTNTTWSTTSFRGEAGTCFSSATGRKISVGHHADFHSSAFTIEGWIKPTTLPVSSDYDYFWYKTTAHLLRIQESGGSVTVRGFCYDGVDYESHVASTTTLSADEWVYVALVYDGDLKLYINGELEDTEVSRTYAPAGSSGIVIGGSGSANELQGSIDEMRYHDVALSGDEIASRFRSEPYLHDWKLMSRVYHKSHDFSGYPVITNGLIMLSFPDYDVYEGRTYDVMLPAVYGWYENSWHLLGYISPYMQVNGTSKYMVHHSDQSEFAIEELTDQYCKLRISYRVVDADWPDENVATFYFIIKSGYPGVIVEAGPENYQIDDRLGFQFWTSIAYGMGSNKPFWYAPNGNMKAAELDASFGLASSAVDDNWCLLIGNPDEGTSPSKSAFIGIFTDSMYDDLGGGTQWYVAESLDYWIVTYAHQTKYGGIFFIPFDIDAMFAEGEESYDDTLYYTLAGAPAYSSVVDGTCSDGYKCRIDCNADSGVYYSKAIYLEPGNYNVIFRAYGESVTLTTAFGVDDGASNARAYTAWTEGYILGDLYNFPATTWTYINFQLNVTTAGTYYVKWQGTEGAGLGTYYLDVDFWTIIPISNSASYAADLAHQPFRNTVPQRAWRIRKETAYELG
jgi:hypothetical protein